MSCKIKEFPRQHSLQRSTNQTCNLSLFFKDKLHLSGIFLCQLLKAICPVSGQNISIGCTFPAFLSAIAGKTSGILKCLPSGNRVVHNIIDFPDFPLLRLVKGMVQCFLVKLFGTNHISLKFIQKFLYHTRLCIFRHKDSLIFFQIILHSRGKGKEIVSASVDTHCFHPHLPDIFP